MVEIMETEFDGLVLLRPKVFGDLRGHFFESYNQKEFNEHGLSYNFIQDNQSVSTFGTIRGLHYQKGQFAQTKLVRVVHGQILDVAVDLRPQSKTFTKFYTIELSDQNHLQILVPKGFAHGFIVLSPSASVAYKCDEFYQPQYEGGILAEDKTLNIDWRIPTKDRIISPKDKKLSTFDIVLKNKDWEIS